MPLTIGARLGSYEILVPLGAGGMGEVYRARDTKLGRAVAIKILPDHLAADSDRIARFEREAKALAFSRDGKTVLFTVVKGTNFFLWIEIMRRSVTARTRTAGRADS